MIYLLGLKMTERSYQEQYCRKVKDMIVVTIYFVEIVMIYIKGNVYKGDKVTIMY